MDGFALALFAGALMLNAGAPGPSVAALVARVLSHGWRDVAPFLAAMWLGEVLWLSAAMAGLTALAEAFHLGFVALKWAGIGYLCWLAWRMWRRAGDSDAEALPQRRKPWSMFAAGMALTLGNPKIMIFYLALLPTIIDLSTASFGAWAVLAATTFLCLAAVDLAWVLLAHKARALLRTPKAMRVANRTGALALGGAAAAIATR